MNCEQARDIILTDCLDERPAKAGAELTAHLAGCPSCAEFLLTARKDLLEPFDVLTREKMPVTVTQAVMSRIRQEREEQLARAEHSWWQDLREALAALNWPVLVPAGALAGILAGWLVFGVMMEDKRLQLAQNERVLFLAQVADSVADKSRDMADYGTTIETYFLEEKENS
ncbi:MAG: hypothetical protein HQL20_06205 [Candidatus Omnitrophica bacterium]|nr:hypothetical protein [Candidatus Omnitrophota bacterium]